MNITSEMVKELRAKTGAGMMDCKEALTAENGDFEKADPADPARPAGWPPLSPRTFSSPLPQTNQALHMTHAAMHA